MASSGADAHDDTIQGFLGRLSPDAKTYESTTDGLMDLLLGSTTTGPAASLSEALYKKALADEALMCTVADCAADVVRILKKSGKAALSDAVVETLEARCRATFDELLVLRMDDECEYDENKTRKLANMRLVAELYTRCVLRPEAACSMVDLLTCDATGDIPPSFDNVETFREFFHASAASLDPETEQVVAQRVAKLARHPSTRVRSLVTSLAAGPAAAAAGQQGAAAAGGVRRGLVPIAAMQQQQQPHPGDAVSEAPSTPSDMSYSMSSPPQMDLTPQDSNRSLDSIHTLERQGSYPLMQPHPQQQQQQPHPHHHQAQQQQQHPAMHHQQQGPQPQQQQQQQAPQQMPVTTTARQKKKDHKAFALQQAQRRDCTVYVVGIDASLPECELLCFIAQCGSIVKVRLCGDTSNRTIYGFFEFDSKDPAELLVSKSGSVLGNYTIHCSFARQAIRDLSHGPADSKIRTLNFEPKGGYEEQPSLRESVLNDPTWFKSQGRNKAKGQQHAAGGAYAAGNNGNGNGNNGTAAAVWDPNGRGGGGGGGGAQQAGGASNGGANNGGGNNTANNGGGGGGAGGGDERAAASLPSVVRHMAQTHALPHGVSLQPVDSAMAIVYTALGDGEYASLTDYIPAFLRACEVWFCSSLSLCFSAASRLHCTYSSSTEAVPHGCVGDCDGRCRPFHAADGQPRPSDERTGRLRGVAASCDVDRRELQGRDAVGGGHAARCSAGLLHRRDGVAAVLHGAVVEPDEPWLRLLRGE